MSRHPHVEFALNVGGAYSEEELESLRQEVEALPPGSTIVEIGVLYGRSTSIYLQAALTKPLNIILIDNWCVNESDAEPAFKGLLAAFPTVKVQLYEMDSLIAAGYVPMCDLLHIDGNHTEPGPQIDCSLYLPKLRNGRVAVFHDYNTLDIDGKTLVFPGLHATVDEFTAGWEDLGVVDRQAKRRKP